MHRNKKIRCFKFVPSYANGVAIRACLQISVTTPSLKEVKYVANYCKQLYQGYTNNVLLNLTY